MVDQRLLSWFCLKGELNGTEQVIGEHRDEEVCSGSSCQLVIYRAKSEIALEEPKVVFDIGESHIDVPDLRGC